MPSLISSQPLPSASIGYCDRNGITPRMNPPKGACDGGGFTARPTIPTGAMTATESTQTGKVGAKGILATAVLLIGGALLGYGHREQISKGLGSMKDAVTKFFSKGKPAEYLATATEWLGKAKDAIFAKKA